MIQDDGSVTNGHGESREIEVRMMSKMVFHESKILSSIVTPSFDPEYDFVVVATWYNDCSMPMLDGTMMDIKSNQTSFTFWKNDKIQKVHFKSRSQVIA